MPTTDDLWKLGNELSLDLTDVHSIWGRGGIATGCEPGFSTSVELDDWRDVDTVIARAAAFVTARDLALQVTVTVDGIPVPD